VLREPSATEESPRVNQRFFAFTSFSVRMTWMYVGRLGHPLQRYRSLMCPGLLLPQEWYQYVVLREPSATEESPRVNSQRFFPFTSFRVRMTWGMGVEAGFIPAITCQTFLHSIIQLSHT
ncbi:MAG: hypothetical protein SVO26_06475, partial [Chloroflexota bacterium]|nr:hypothetical protein [Chloroflexota bacterium]